LNALFPLHNDTFNIDIQNMTRALWQVRNKCWLCEAEYPVYSMSLVTVLLSLLLIGSSL